MTVNFKLLLFNFFRFSESDKQQNGKHRKMISVEQCLRFMFHWWSFNVAAIYLFAWVGKNDFGWSGVKKLRQPTDINELRRLSGNTDSVFTITAACKVKHQNQDKRMSSIDFCQNSTTVPGINYSRQTPNSSGGWLIEISHSLSNFTEKCWKTTKWKTKKFFAAPRNIFPVGGTSTHSLPSKTENCFNFTHSIAPHR